MKFKLLSILLTVALAGCNKTVNTPEAEAQAEPQEQTVSIEGKWMLSEYSGATEWVTLDNEADYCLELNADQTFGMQTDCNGMGGQYIGRQHYVQQYCYDADGLPKRRCRACNS